MHPIIKSRNVRVEEGRAERPSGKRVELLADNGVVHAIRLSCPCGEHTVLELEYEASRPDAPGPVDAAPAAEVRE